MAFTKKEPIKKISINPKDTAFRVDYWKYTVYLDGELVKDCVAADVDGKWVEVYEQDAKGLFKRKGDEIARKRLTGKVEIRAA